MLTKYFSNISRAMESEEEEEEEASSAIHCEELNTVVRELALKCVLLSQFFFINADVHIFLNSWILKSLISTVKKSFYINI